MITLHNNGVFLAGGVPAAAGPVSPEEGRKRTMAWSILQAHNISGDPEHLQIRFDAMVSHDITYVGIIQQARASGMKEFPIPYALTNCHNSLCAVGGTINEDDHVFGLSAAKKYGGIYVPANQSVIHSYAREQMAKGGTMILGTVDFTATQTEPELAWGRIGNTLDYGYYINRSGNKKYLELSCYPVEVELTVPNWMKIADVTLELRTGEEGEPLATAQLAADGWYSSGEETMMHAVWNGTFYKDDGPNKWLYADGQPFYRAIVTDATSTTWTFEVPLQKK